MKKRFTFPLLFLFLVALLFGCIAKKEPPHEHSYISNVVAATCESSGYTQYCCECGDSYISNETAPLEHQYGDWITIIEPTYEAEGKKEKQCIHCDSSISESIPKLIPHEHICIDSIIPATCTQAGVFMQVCQECGTVISEKALKALGHSWSSWEIIKEATTTETGTKTRTCKTCSEEENKEIPRKEEVHQHDFKESVVEPTCTEGGYTLRECDCGESYKTDETTKRGHLYGDWTTTKMPTTTETGEKQCVCSRCGNVNKETISKLDEATAEKYESYIDPRIEIETYGNGRVSYFYYPVGVTDARTWGDPPTIRINAAGGFDLFYYKQDGTKVTYTLNPVEGYVNSLTIRSDGSFVTQLWGDYKD